jgi:hypothetical protein
MSPLGHSRRFDDDGATSASPPILAVTADTAHWSKSRRSGHSPTQSERIGVSYSASNNIALNAMVGLLTEKLSAAYYCMSLSRGCLCGVAVGQVDLGFDERGY